MEAPTSPECKVSITGLENSPARARVDFNVKQLRTEALERSPERSPRKTAFEKVRSEKTAPPGSTSPLRDKLLQIQNAENAEGIYTSSPGKAKETSPRAERLDSGMREALQVAEQFEKGLTPPPSPAEERAAKKEEFESKLQQFSPGSDKGEEESQVKKKQDQFEKQAGGSQRRAIKPSILERMKMFEA
ncbi:hypothetical protein HOP50_03g19840 [Chloropicon primus]|uniref:Uncharacterized protein n=1 Tax=Chloropicon primus TaxID=1764295 RepID=A0A5B8MFM7_9CHLO|nr:hypothetical protein A3770_03p19860 [Chloropicon primus]UPQ98678.1 hypothetical protein HOP50_03g19840 [Chloropicon primus]|eukprot:QDZ19468.1 hypothetical protein A3770_03p19860 [Chloropicon primus]